MVKYKKSYQNIWLWIIATVVLGTIWHFVYQITGSNLAVGLLAPVNESVWEHLKIVFTPLLIVGIIQYFIVKKDRNSYWTGLLMGMITAMLIVIFGFYLYSSLLGENLLIDIGLYIASIIVAIYVAAYVRSNLKTTKVIDGVSIIVITIVGLSLVYLTIAPPKFSPFIESGSQTYGIFKTPAN
jgi:hypothetical protein